jgi:hypothetical protein
MEGMTIEEKASSTLRAIIRQVWLFCEGDDFLVGEIIKEALQEQAAETCGAERERCADRAYATILKMCGTSYCHGCQVGEDLAVAVHAACMNTEVQG